LGGTSDDLWQVGRPKMPSEQRSIIAKNRIHSSLHREACPPRQRGTPPGKYDERVYFDSCLVVCVILCWLYLFGLVHFNR
jgi:hypothetical protein